MERVTLKIDVMVDLSDEKVLDRLQKATLDQPLVQLAIPQGASQHVYHGRFIGATQAAVEAHT